MPCVLKQKTASSPGVIAFTHNEVLSGVPCKFKRVRDFLYDTSKSSEWIYGVHIQGDCTHLKSWPIESWQSFIMWSDPGAQFLSNVPTDQILPLTCINFMPASLISERIREKIWDICIISRPSDIKRITETLYIIRKLLDFKPNLKVVFIVADPRRQELGQKAYKTQGIDKNFFDLPRKIFSCSELENISFICSSQISFGNFPLSANLVADIVAKSKFLLLTSHSEGVPRVLAEALLLGTPCIVSKFLRSGINRLLTPKNSIFIDDEIVSAAHQILGGLDNYNRYVVDREEMNREFNETLYQPILMDTLSKLITSTGCQIEGKWYLNNLSLRLACHGQKNNYQFMNNEKLFWDWMEKVEKLSDDEPSEDRLFGADCLPDNPKLSIQMLAQYARNRFLGPVKRRLMLARSSF